MNKTERQELFTKLYNDSKKRKEKYKKLSMEKEAKFNTIYTFTPKIITNKLNEKYLKNMADTKFTTNNNTNTTTFYNNNGINDTSLLTNTNNNTYSLLNNAKMDTNKNNKNELGVVQESKMEFPLDFMTRLGEYEKIKKMNLEKIKNEVDINIKGNNIYKYKNKYQNNKIPNNHLLNNSQKYLELKQKNLEKIAKNMFEEQGITFQPKTNKLFNDKIKNDIIERNKEFIKDKQEKLEKFSYLKEKECTFKPKINTVSTLAILNNSKTGQNSSLNNKIEPNNDDVSKRLFDYQNKYKEKLEDIRSKYKVSYSFKPEISKNTDSILNNKKKMMEQIKENENNLINNIQEGYGYDYNNLNNGENNDYNTNNNNNINNELLLKQMKLGELEEISKRINELSEENKLFTDEKITFQKNNNDKNDKKINNRNKNKVLNENKQIVFNDDNNSIENNNNFQINPSLKKRNVNNIPVINPTNNENSDQILELAKNLLKESNQQKSSASNENMNYYYNNKSREGTNDFGALMMYNNNSKNNRYYNNDYKFPSYKKSNYEKEYDFDNIKGSKKIMNLNYYDSLL